ncbi:MAG: type II toxin-antitoxin system HicB family antitoxin [Candidatus Helarchaeota archaeon]|nr:type II toxin-antitoxin system HicB family antitoxin [Candidatus Helarchaeota archaeon]
MGHTVLIEQDKNGKYIANVPDYKGISAQGDSLEEVVRKIKESIEKQLQIDRSRKDSF